MPTFARAIAAVTAPIAAAVALLGTGATVDAAEPSGGMLRTLPHGIYDCALPGDATGAAKRVLPRAGFAIGHGSTYSVGDRWGTYLLTGRHVAFTRGPMKGTRFLREGERLRRLGDEGEPTRVVCTRRGGTR